jgi:hypothetical protein
LQPRYFIAMRERRLRYCRHYFYAIAAMPRLPLMPCRHYYYYYYRSRRRRHAAAAAVCHYLRHAAAAADTPMPAIIIDYFAAMPDFAAISLRLPPCRHAMPEAPLRAIRHAIAAMP